MLCPSNRPLTDGMHAVNLNTFSPEIGGLEDSISWASISIATTAGRLIRFG